VRASGGGAPGGEQKAPVGCDAAARLRRTRSATGYHREKVWVPENGLTRTGSVSVSVGAVERSFAGVPLVSSNHAHTQLSYAHSLSPADEPEPAVVNSDPVERSS